MTAVGDDDVLDAVAERGHHCHGQYEQRNAIITSTKRPTERSRRPPAYPQNAPMIAPSTKEMPTAETAMTRSSRVATRSRLNVSRPSWSVPARCRRLGGNSASDTLDAIGSYGTTEGPQIAMSINIRTPVAATAVSGLPRNTQTVWTQRRACHQIDTRGSAMP